MPTMRKPSTFGQLYAWHRAALVDPDLPRHDGIPECGWFKMREVKGGPWVAVCIWCDRDIDMKTGELTSDERLLGAVNGERRNPSGLWSYVKPISKQRYDALVERIANTPAMAATKVPMNSSEAVF